MDSKNHSLARSWWSSVNKTLITGNNSGCITNFVDVDYKEYIFSKFRYLNDIFNKKNLVCIEFEKYQAKAESLVSVIIT
jgi:hypothetical protein